MIRVPLTRLAATAGTLLLCALPICPHAADDETIIVTASRSSEPLDETLAPVTVITRADLERLQTQDLTDVFPGLPGLSLATNGGPGKSTALFVRGTESDHVLVLIDGIKVGSATSGSTPFEQIPVDQIERIEIVRGPRSSLYGSEALGGVIQIFTRRARAGQGFVPTFSAGGGTRGDGRFDGGVRGRAGNGWFGVGVSGRSTDGVNVRPNQNQPDKDGYRSLAGSVRAGWRFDDGAEISASFLQADGENDFDGSSQNESETRTQVYGVTARVDPLRPWTVDLSAGQSRDVSDNFLDGDFVGDFVTRRDHVGLINELRIGEAQRISVGGDHQRDRVSGATDYAETSRDNRGIFALYRAEIGAHELSLSGRSDDNEQFGTHRTGGAAYGYRVAPWLRAAISHGTAFKAPTFNELYFPGFGNPDIGPEDSRSTEISLAGAAGRYQWMLNAYRTRIDDLIAFDAAISAPANIDRARIRGVEAQFGAAWDALRVQTFLTWLKPENDAGGANDGNTLPRRRERTARLDADYTFRALSVGFTVFGASDGYDNIANTTPLPGYATLDLRAGWQVLPEWLLQIEGRNVLDKDYETAATYQTYGAGFMATVRFTPSGT
ncbi:MAG: TonB-dependent vitamin receptor [Panacagrimonas sp.]|nr:TonB-dependent vitamin B12 receptor [Panacagrimonas sp.]MCC2656450.1 TonB-dependent vitamin receptor [Panacagrimonas sp.]